MTAPVVQQQGEKQGEKIAMTAPVVQQQEGEGGTDWTVHFVMPSEYTMETLPQANNEAVTVKEVPGMYVNQKHVTE